MGKRKNPAAVTLAKRRMIAMTPEERRRVALTGAAVGGQAGAKNLTPAESKAIGRKAAASRGRRRIDPPHESLRTSSGALPTRWMRIGLRLAHCLPISGYF